MIMSACHRALSPLFHCCCLSADYAGIEFCYFLRGVWGRIFWPRPSMDKDAMAEWSTKNSFVPSSMVSQFDSTSATLPVNAFPSNVLTVIVFPVSRYLLIRACVCIFFSLRKRAGLLRLFDPKLHAWNTVFFIIFKTYRP